MRDLHIAQWRRNRELITKIPGTHPDWVATVTFYTALHAVDALLCEESNHHDHTSRNDALMALHPDLFKHYKPLFEISREVRYTPCPEVWVKLEDYPIEVFGRLSKIEKAVMGALKLSVPAPVVHPALTRKI